MLLLLSGLFLALLSSATPGFTQTPQNTFQLFFSARRGGTLEPCGCAPDQGGGLQHEAALYSRHSAPAGLRLDAGGWAQARPDLLPLDALKSRTMLRALHAMGFDAINVGAPELQLGWPFFQDFARHYPEAFSRLLSANVFLKTDPTRNAFAAYRILHDAHALSIGLTGVTSTTLAADSGLHLADPRASLSPVVSALRPRVALLILLCSGNSTFTQEIARAFPQVDLILTTAPPHAAANPRILTLDGPDGRRISQATMTLINGRWMVSRTASITIQKDIPPAPEILGLLDEFKRATHELPAPPPPPGAREVYAGQARCVPCHRQIHEHWSATPHARALRTLAERNQLFNPDCVACHVTAWRRDNGFYGAQFPASQAMAGVQCEACHGPARMHAEQQEQIVGGAALQMTPEQYAHFLELAKRDRPRRAVPAPVCRACHDAAHDPAFHYQEQLKKIAHPPAPGGSS